MKSDSVVSFLRNVTVSCAKCSTAMRMFLLISASPQSETNAGLREPAGDGDRRAVGAPAGRARQRAVAVELDRVHAAADGGHLDHLVPDRAQFFAHGLGDCLLDFERVTFGPDP